MVGYDSVRFNLSQISKEEFDNLHSLVKACFDQGRQRVTPKLRSISNDVEDMPEVHRENLRATSDALALTMTTHGTRADVFDIWMLPQLLPGNFRFYQTLVHELVHGYAGIYCGHNAHWRRWFYRTLWHADQAQMLPEHESELRMICFSVGTRYTKDDPWKELKLIDEAFSKAESEHTKVMDAYLERVL